MLLVASFLFGKLPRAAQRGFAGGLAVLSGLMQVYGVSLFTRGSIQVSISRRALAAAAGAATVCAFACPAMAANPVNIQDPKTPDAMANVDAGDRLAVEKVPPSSFFHSLSGLGGTTCVLVAAAPSGKALVARQIRVLTLSDSGGQCHYLFLHNCGLLGPRRGTGPPPKPWTKLRDVRSRPRDP